MSKTETPDIVALLRERGAWHDEGKVWEQDALCVAAAAKIERLRAELAKHQWRTMDSAPKDGTPVLLSIPAHDAAHIGRWNDDAYAKTPRPFWEWDSYSKTILRSHQPIAWRFLPIPTLAAGRESMSIAKIAQPLFNVGTRVGYYDRQHRWQVGTVRRIEASWHSPGEKPFIVYTVSHPTYRNGLFYTSNIKGPA